MFLVLWVLAAGLGLGTLIGHRDRRPLARRITVALVGSYAGALLGGLAWSLLAVSAAAASSIEAGIVLGSVGGALAAQVADQRLERTAELVGGSHDRA